MRELGGEFVCLPFGVGSMPSGLTPRWRTTACDFPQPLQHGICADEEWELISSSQTHIELRIAYPNASDIHSVRRVIRADSASPALDMQVSVYARSPTELPFALHPIFRLPEQPSAVSIRIPFRCGFTYPAILPPGISRLAKDVEFDKLEAVPLAAGGSVEFSQLPQGPPAEEFLQLAGATGEAVITYTDERARVRLTWDPRLLPSCLVWVSDRSLQEAPWCGRFRGLAIEPAAAAFDLPVDLARRPNPISATGSPTALSVRPGQPTVIAYRLAAEEVSEKLAAVF